MKVFAIIFAAILPIIGVSAVGGTRTTKAYTEFESPEEFRRRLEDQGGAGHCNLWCKSNSDCKFTGSNSDEYNPCTKCGQDVGTEFYRRCYNPKEDASGMWYVSMVRHAIL